MCRILLTLFVWFLSGVFVRAQTYVSPDGSGGGTSWADPSSLADAIANASNGDELWLEQGTYNVLSPIIVDKTLEILGGFSGTGNQRDHTLYPSIIDGQHTVNILRTSSSANNTLFDGISFVNGYADIGVDENDIKGGALYISGNGTRINNCIFKDNTSENRIGSGAIYLWSVDNIVIENSSFESNRVIQNEMWNTGNMGGGAIHIRFGSHTRIENCRFVNNSSYYDGGTIDAWGEDVQIINCHFEDNRSNNSGGAIYVRFDNIFISGSVFLNNAADGRGGAINFNSNTDPSIITNSIFTANSSLGIGGAIGNGTELSISNSSFNQNISSDRGGAINNNHKLSISNSLFNKNTTAALGGAIYNGEELYVTNSTFVSNEKTAIIHPFRETTEFSVYSTHIFNSIFYGNTAGSINGVGLWPDVDRDSDLPDESDKDFRRNIFQENTNGINNLIGSDPLFQNFSGGDFSLEDNSPAADYGRNPLYTAVKGNGPGADEDLAGNDRLFGTYVDAGAYELQSTSTLTPPNCTTLSSPIDGDLEVAVSSSIQWDAVADAIGYRISIGTTSGGTDVVDGEELTGTTYTPGVGWEEGTTYYVTVIPFNAAGEAEGCAEISFTTETLLVAPECTTIIFPTDGEEGVALDAEITWEEVENVDGYRIYIGTAAGGTDVVDGEEVTGTTYAHTSDWEEGTSYYVTVVPFNATGEADGCAEISFTTIARPEPPQADDQQFCPPATVADLVATGTGIRWYDQVTGGTASSPETALSTGTYYVTQTVGGLESDRRAVAVTIESPAAPQFNGDITGCGNLTVADLEDMETGLRWYGQATGGAPLSPTAALSSGTYYASRVSGACESDRTAVQVIISVTPVPDVPDQNFMPGSTFEDLDVTGQNLQWYTEPSGSTPFDPQTVISNGTYYVSQTIDGCESDRVIVQINITSAPNCVTNISPANNATAIAVNASITWDAVDNADGYRVYIGTTSGGTDVVNGEEVTGRSYTPASDWEEGITYYVTVVPFNAAGNATGCIETSFTVEEADVPLPEVPECTTIIHPIDGESISPLEPGITWLPVAGADGYRITIGTTADNGDLVDGVEVNSTVYRPTFEFAENTTYYISVTPFNTAGEATGCGQLRFTIVPDNSINRTKYGFSPNGDGINDYWSIDGIEQYPHNTVSIYNRWGDLVFQIEGYDNQSNIFRGEANKLNRLGAGVLPSGTYFFTIQYHDGQETKRVEGFVVLRR